MALASEQENWSYTPAFLPVSEAGMSAVSAHGSVRLQELLRAGGGTQPAHLESPDYVTRVSASSGEVSGDSLADLGTAGVDVDNVLDRKSTRLNSSHVRISYAVFCLKKKMRSRPWCGASSRRCATAPTRPELARGVPLSLTPEGIFFVDKPAVPSSFAIVRRVLSRQRASHRSCGHARSISVEALAYVGRTGH